MHCSYGTVPDTEHIFNNVTILARSGRVVRVPLTFEQRVEAATEAEAAAVRAARAAGPVTQPELLIAPGIQYSPALIANLPDTVERGPYGGLQRIGVDPADDDPRVRRYKERIAKEKKEGKRDRDGNHDKRGGGRGRF